MRGINAVYILTLVQAAVINGFQGGGKVAAFLSPPTVCRGISPTQISSVRAFKQWNVDANKARKKSPSPLHMRGLPTLDYASRQLRSQSTLLDRYDVSSPYMSSRKEPAILKMRGQVATKELMPWSPGRNAVEKRRKASPAQEEEIFRNNVLREYEGKSTAEIEKAARNLYAHAKECDISGDLNLSAHLLRKVSVLDPTNGRVWIRLSRLEAQKGDTVRAEAYLVQGLQHCPKNGFIWHALGAAEYKTGNFERARFYFQRAVEVDPSTKNAWDMWGRLEMKEGNIKDAAKIFHKGTSYNESSHRLWHGLGVALDRLGRPSEAIHAFDKGLSIQYNNPFLLVAKAISVWREGNVKGAREILTNCVQSNPRVVDGYLALAQLEEAEGRVDDARHVYRKATEKYGPAYTKDPALWQSWARMEQLQGDYYRAQMVYAGATVRFESNAKLWVNWAKFEADNMNETKARDLLEHALTVDRKSALAHRASAELEMDLGEYHRARTILLRASCSITEPSDLAPIYLTWAIVEWRLSNIDHARKLFEWAVRVSKPEFVAIVWMDWSRMEKEFNNLDLACNYCSRAVNADPKYFEAWFLLSSIERLRGKQERSEEYKRRALELLKQFEKSKDTLKQQYLTLRNRKGWTIWSGENHVKDAQDRGHPFKREFLNKKVAGRITKRF